MDAHPFIPLPDATPVPWGWFKALLILTFVLHLLFMNLMLGGSLLAFFGRLRGRPSPPSTSPSGAGSCPPRCSRC